jgi:hypothetical protein
LYALRNQSHSAECEIQTPPLPLTESVVCALVQKWVHAYLPHEISLESVAEEVAQHKVYFHGTDMQGRPNIIVHLAKHNPRVSSIDDTLQLLVFLLEQAQVLYVYTVPMHTDVIADS